MRLATLKRSPTFTLKVICSTAMAARTFNPQDYLLTTSQINSTLSYFLEFASQDRLAAPLPPAHHAIVERELGEEPLEFACGAIRAHCAVAFDPNMPIYWLDARVARHWLEQLDGIKTRFGERSMCWGIHWFETSIPLHTCIVRAMDAVTGRFGKDKRDA